MHIPGLDQWWGFFAVLVLMVGVALLLHRSFRRSGWL